MLQNYLSIFTKGVCQGQNGNKFSVGDFDRKRALLRTCIKGMFEESFFLSILYQYACHNYSCYHIIYASNGPC